MSHQFHFDAEGFIDTKMLLQTLSCDMQNHSALDDSTSHNSPSKVFQLDSAIMEYGSTPYVGMALQKMVSPLTVYKMTCSKLSCTQRVHRLLTQCITEQLATNHSAVRLRRPSSLYLLTRMVSVNALRCDL